MGTSGPARSTALAVAVSAFVACAVLVVVERLAGADARWDDNVVAFRALMVTSVRLWREGSPFWDPYAHGGEPMLPQSGGGTLYPPSLLVALLASPEDLPQVWLVVHAAIAAAGAAFLARTLGRGGDASVLAGVAYGLGEPLLQVAKCWMVHGLGAAWTPWLLALLIRAGRGSLASVGLAGLALGLQVLEGHGVEAATYAVPLGLLLSRVCEPTRGGAWRVGAAVALGSLIASPFVLETLACMGLSNRAAPPEGGSQLAPEALLSAIFPVSVPRATFHSLIDYPTGLYQGFVPLVLLLATGLRETRPAERVLGVVGLAATIAALGDHTHSSALWAHLPVLRGFHHPVGRLHLVGLAVALLGATAADRVARASRARLAATCAVLVVAAALAYVQSAFAGGITERAARAAAGVAAGLGVATLLASAALVLVPAPQRARVAAALTALLLSLQLAFFWRGGAILDHRPITAGAVAEVISASRATQGRVAPFFTEGELRLSPLPATAGRQECGVHGFPSISGYSVLYRVEIASLFGIGAMGHLRTPPGGTATDHLVRVLSGSLLEASGVRFVHGSRTLAAALEGSKRTERFVERWRARHAFTLESTRYAGRAYRVSRAESGGADALLDRTDLLDTAVVASSSPLAGRSFGPGQVGAFDERPGRVSVALAPAPAGLLVVTCGYAPGWRALVDGQPAAIHEVQGMFMGVEVPAGARAVVLSYESRPIAAGLFLLAVGLAGVAAFVVLGLKRAAPLSADASRSGGA